LAAFEKIFDADRMGKRERVERTLNLEPVDRGALLKKALDAAPDGPCNRRVAFFKKGFDEARESLAKMKRSK